MKGIIFNVAEHVVTEQHGADAWDDLLVAAGVDGVYTAVGNYPDAEFSAIVAATARARGTTVQDVERWIGRRGMPLLADRYGDFFEPADARAFVLTLNDVIHPEVRKLYPDVNVPDFDYEHVSETTLVVEYRSDRRMCGFAEGLILGAVDWYGESAVLGQDACMHDGAPACLIRCDFDAASGPT